MKIELTITEIAARLGVSERTALRRISDGKLTAQRLGANRYLVSTSDIEELAPQAKLASLESQVKELASELTRQPVQSADTAIAEHLQQQVQEIASELSYQSEVIEALKQELAELRERVLALERGKSRRAKPVQADVGYEVPPPASASDEIPAGAIPLKQLAEELKVSVSTFRGHLKNQGFDHIAIPKASRPGEYTRYFTEAQADKVREWHAANSKKPQTGLWDES